MRQYKYILVDKQPVVITSTLEWGRWMEDADRQVALETIGAYQVSTIFLGLDHAIKGPPSLFETMVFDAEQTERDFTDIGRGKVMTYVSHDDYTRRYATWEQAEVGHRQVCDEVRRKFIRRVV